MSPKTARIVFQSVITALSLTWSYLIWFTPNQMDIVQNILVQGYILLVFVIMTLLIHFATRED